jgi:PmbA protein
MGRGADDEAAPAVDLARLLGTLRTRRSGGAAIREWSILAQEGRRLVLGVRDREVGSPHTPLRVAESAGASYKLIWDDGLVSRGWLERRQLGTDVGEALDQARAAACEDPDGARVAGPAAFPEVPTYDPATARAASGETALLAQRLELVQARIAGAGCRTWSASFSAGEGRSRVVTSSGLDAEASGTSAGWHVTVNGEVGDGFESRRPEEATAFSERLERLLATAARLASDAVPLTPGVRPVLLDPGVVEEYVLGTLLHNLSGSVVADGEGHFRRNQFGSDVPVLREDLTLRLDPLLPFRRGSYRFTAEGIPATPCRYIERGRLVQPICDLKYAHRLGIPPTPGPAASDTLFLESRSELSLEEALARTSGGALVLSVLGVHTQDAASGDFSLSAPQALRIEDGTYAGRLRTTLSGNLFRILASESLELVRFDGEHTPGLLFPCRLDPR